MKRDWTQDELVEHWTLAPGELVLLMNKSGPGRLGFSALLKFFQAEARFPAIKTDVPAAAVDYLALQTKTAQTAWAEYDWQGRTIKYHRAEIRALWGFREAASEDGEALVVWLCGHVLSQERHSERIQEAALQRLRELRIEPPTADRMERLIRSALRNFEDDFSRRLSAQLSPETKKRLNALLELTSPELVRVPLHELRADPGPASIETLEEELAKLSLLRDLHLPPGLFDGLAPRIVESYRRRVAVEEVFELKRHPEPLRLTLLPAFCHLRTRELIDTLSDLLIDMVHRVAHRAEVRVELELIADFKRVSGKNSLLFQIAEASLDHPDSAVKDVVYPIASEATLRDLVKEFKATGPAYRQQLHTVMRSAYRSHYRAMLIWLLGTLEFRSGNEMHRPVLDALAIVKKYAGSRLQYIRRTSSFPLPVLFVDRGRKPSSSATAIVQNVSTGSRMRCAFCLPFANVCARRRSGSKEPIATATPTRTCRATSSANAPLTTPHSGCPPQRTASLPAFNARCTKHWPRFTTAWRTTRVCVSLIRKEAGSHCRPCRCSRNRRIWLPSKLGCLNAGR